MAHVLLILFAVFGVIHTEITTNENLGTILEKIITKSRFKNGTKPDNENSKIFYVKAPIEESITEGNLTVQDNSLVQLQPDNNQVIKDDNNHVVTTHLTVVTIDDNSEQTIHHKFNTSDSNKPNVYFEYKEKLTSDDNNILAPFESEIIVTKTTEPFNNPGTSKSKSKGFRNKLAGSGSQSDDKDPNLHSMVVKYVDNDDEINFRMFTPKEWTPSPVNPEGFINNINPYEKHHPCPNHNRCTTVLPALFSNLRMFQRSLYPTARITYSTSYVPLAVLNSNYALHRAMQRQKLNIFSI